MISALSIIMFFVAIFLLFLSPVLSAATDIYVSSSDGINNTSCWTGGVQTPCATLDLAIQGAATAQGRGRGGGGGKPGIIIYLLPGTYTATVLEQRLISNNVSIISMRNENEPIVPRSLSAVEYSHCLMNLNVQFINLTLLGPTKYFNTFEN
uniref:Pectate lyase superfamily protein domain-containing protein n=1 Tax=Amphimedon queenslandica TaxID=400682 RepID=A0A1X7SXC7_AMPQE